MYKAQFEEKGIFKNIFVRPSFVLYQLRRSLSKKEGKSFSAFFVLGLCSSLFISL